LLDAADARAPSDLHPIFFGSFDWHSCVHGYWLLANVLRRYPDSTASPRIMDLFDRRLRPESVAAELRYAASRPSFERPYGWVWLLQLGAELDRSPAERARRWRDALAPLVQHFEARLIDALHAATLPVRAGVHASSAFCLALAASAAKARGSPALSEIAIKRARAWFAGDAAYQVREPDAWDFLSPALVEIECMRRALPASAFPEWLARFLPDLERGEPVVLFDPVIVHDRADLVAAHLDGLNLSRAWCFRGLVQCEGLPPGLRERADAAAARHIAASLPHLDDDYAGAHWLATYAWLALEGLE